MRRSLISKHLDSRNSLQPSNLQSLRERILNAALLMGLILGVIAVFVAVPAKFQDGNIVLAVFYLILFAWLLLITIVRNLSYNFRAVSLLGIIFILGTIALLNDGLYGNGRLFLVSFPIFSTILFGGWAGFWSLLISWGLLGGIAYLSMRGILVIQEPPTVIKPDLEPLEWSLAIAVFFLVCGTLYGSLRTMLNGLQRVLENEANLNADLQVERAQLERRVQLRTQDLEHRMMHIRTAAEISNKINAILTPQELIQHVVDLILSDFNLYYVGLFEINETGDKAVLKAGTGEAGRHLLANEQTVAINSASVVGRAILNHKAQVAFDAGQDAFYFDNPYLPETHSELAVPLLSNRFNDPLFQLSVKDSTRSCLGAISLQSNKPMAFDMDDTSIFQLIANSLVTALENATLFQKVRQNLEEISTLNRQYLRESWSRARQYHGMLSFSVVDDQTQVESGNLQTYTVPLILRDQVIGILTLEKSVKEGEGLNISPDDRTFVDAVVTEAALALENVRLLEETHKRANNERLLSKLSLKARSSTDIETILRLAVKELGLGLGASETLIRLQVPAIDISEGSKQDAPKGLQTKSKDAL